MSLVSLFLLFLKYMRYNKVNMKNSNFDKKILDELRVKLVNEKSNIEAELENIATKNPNVEGDWKAKYKNLGSSWDENSQEVSNYTTAISIEKTLEERLGRIVRALSNMEEGTYGLCKVDGKIIPLKRLLAKPEATTCLDHAS